LRQEFYGLPHDPELLIERTIKEARHEWGHAMGLRHCRRYDCVMRASPSVDQIDAKGEDFCEECRTMLGEVLSKSEVAAHR
jgi:archaemetzincin